MQEEVTQKTIALSMKTGKLTAQALQAALKKYLQHRAKGPKLHHLTDGISAAFANPLPSLHPFDLCVGLAGAVAVRLIVYSKGKNAKKYRKGEEYGSARWSA